MFTKEKDGIILMEWPYFDFNTNEHILAKASNIKW